MGQVHRIELPREVILGESVIDLTGEVMKRLNMRSILIASGEHTYAIAGERVARSIKNAGMTVGHIVVEASTMSEVERVREVIREVGPDAVAGVGGGKIIDVAKLSSSDSGIPFISVPTNASHDGTTSPFASIKGRKRPYSVEARAPIAVIADTSVIGKAPYRFIASGCGDIVGKYTAVRDWELGHRRTNEYYSEYAADLALMSAKLVLKNAKGIRKNTQGSIRIVVKALISCGVAMSVAGSSRPCSGSEHLFSHALDFLAPKPALHGEQCGVGTIMMANLHGLDWRFVKKRLRVIGAPTTAVELGIDPEYVIKALTQARSIRPERYTILDERELAEETAERLARETEVI